MGMDLSALGFIYLFILLPKWKDRLPYYLIVNSLMFLYIVLVLYFILMPILSALPSIFFPPLQPLLHGYRSFDVTDLITNTVGGGIGYVMYRLIIKILS